MSKRLDKSDVFKERLRKCYKNKTDANGERITQSKIAQALGCSIDTVNAWCSGLLPSTTYLMALADYLKCDVDYLLGRIDYVSHENKFISEKTGLSEAAVNNLKDWTTWGIIEKDYIDIINSFLNYDSDSNESFDECLYLISRLKKEVAQLQKEFYPIFSHVIGAIDSNDISQLYEVADIAEKKFRIVRSYYFDAVEKFKKAVDNDISNFIGKDWYNVEKEFIETFKKAEEKRAKEEK